MAIEDEKWVRVENKIDKMNIALTAVAKDVEYHIKRTDLAEKRLDVSENRLSIVETQVSGVKSFFVISGLVLGAVSTILLIVSYFVKLGH